MKVLSTIILGVFLYVVASSAYNIFYTTQIKHNEITSLCDEKSETEPLYGSVIKITHDNGLCSAVVFDQHYALTATHCVIDGFGIMHSDNFQVLSSDGMPITTAKAVASDKMRDVALLKGDFSLFKKDVVDFDGKLMHDIRNMPAITCGFPGGGELFCSLLTLQGTMDFKLLGFGGILQQGMSGGPLYDAATNEVIGINSAVSGNYTIFGNLIGIRSVFGL